VLWVAASPGLGESTFHTLCAVSLTSIPKLCPGLPHQSFPNILSNPSRPILPAFCDKYRLCCSPYSGISSITYQQPHKPEEYMSQCNIWPASRCMIQSMAVWMSQQGLSYNIQYMGDTLQGPVQIVRVQVCRGKQGWIPGLSFHSHRLVSFWVTRAGLSSHCPWSPAVSQEVKSSQGKAVTFRRVILPSEARSGMHFHLREAGLTQL
jgi:hypothetical protein